MHAILILGGASRRFWPLEEKPLFEICGKPLLTHQIDRLRDAGLDQISLVASEENAGSIRDLYPEMSCVVQDPALSGMRGAVVSALEQLNISDPILIVSGNDVIESSGYKDLLDTDGDGALLAKEVESYFPGGYLSLEGNQITEIVEKPGEGKEPSNLVNLVAHVHRDPGALLEVLQQTSNDADDGYEQALSILFKTKEYQAVSYTGSWHPVKYPWHLLPLLEHLLGEIKEPSIHPSAQIHSSAVVEGNVVIEEGVRVFAHASIVGPCWIGKDSVIANNALVRSSSVGRGCLVGYSSEIARSILSDGCETHLTYVGDSVVGEGSSFGGGCITGNLRLDGSPVPSVVGGEKVGTGLSKMGVIVGSNTRLGIQTGTTPGVKIGKNCIVVPGGLQVGEDIPDRMFVKRRGGELEMKENRLQ